jgi:hypothetical protein
MGFGCEKSECSAIPKLHKAFEVTGVTADEATYSNACFKLLRD